MDVHQLKLLMTEGTGRSHKVCVAPPCMRGIVNPLNKVWLHGAITGIWLLYCTYRDDSGLGVGGQSLGLANLE